MSGRMYGFFRCTKCRAQWESAYVYCIPGTNRVYYQQDCKSCNTACDPYKVEELKCAMCGQTQCICSVQDRMNRHSDPNKPHRHDLCHKCRRGLPCLHY